MPTPDQPYLLVVGPAQHGVRRYASDLATATGGESGPSLNSPPARVHAHVTDRIFGSSPEEAADRVEALGASTKLTITLHDVPQQSDGTNLGRRIDAYRRFVAAARGGVVVNSRHEAMLLEEHLGRAAADVRIIPLGARARNPVVGSVAGAARPHTVLISGFIYPGKGHLEAIQAAAVAGAAAGGEPATVVAVGAPSTGHERDAEELARRAAEIGVGFRVTGFLDDEAYRSELLSGGVPLAAHQHVSASRSILDWAELGRRALVVDSRYAREMETLRPGSITLFRPEELARRLEAAWRDPRSTWLTPSTSLSPTLDDVAAEYAAWWRDVA